MVTWMLTVLLAMPAQAADCDVRALKNELTEASPVAVPEVYGRLAECNVAEAKRQAKAAFGKILAGDGGNMAVVSALTVGADTDVRSWLDGLEPDQRSGTIAWLGTQCREQPRVQEFFVDAHRDLGPRFFRDRWHRGLADCRTADIQKLLSEALANDPTETRGQFFTLLEVFCRNLGMDALPVLTDLIAKTQDEEELTYLVNAYADAANVGSVEGTNPDVAVKATAELVQLGPTLPPRAVEQARTTLTALGAVEVADGFATHRWRDRKRDGVYHYAVAIVAIDSCKNGKKQATLHLGQVREGGQHWPEQVESGLLANLEGPWALRASAKKCKGTADLSLSMTREPIPDDDAAKQFNTAQVKAFEARAGEFSKAAINRHEDTQL